MLRLLSQRTITVTRNMSIPGDDKLTQFSVRGAYIAYVGLFYVRICFKVISQPASTAYRYKQTNLLAS